MRPTKGSIVIVVTPDREINGQREHAAIVTQLWGSDDEHPAMNVMVMPGSGDPFPLGSVPHEGWHAPLANSPYWRWPSSAPAAHDGYSAASS